MKLINVKRNTKKIYAFFGIIGVTPLLSSRYMVIWQFFWIFIFIAVSKNKIDEIKNNE